MLVEFGNGKRGKMSQPSLPNMTMHHTCWWRRSCNGVSWLGPSLLLVCRGRWHDPILALFYILHLVLLYKIRAARAKRKFLHFDTPTFIICMNDFFITKYVYLSEPRIIFCLRLWETIHCFSSICQLVTGSILPKVEIFYSCCGTFWYSYEYPIASRYTTNNIICA